ncbi:hypothetical protein FNYG_14184 [Fusarium nygamai]|uniref:Uncharacterized protein n=1 Tax=Gibberella nygamai TaxID=42673 RepID=A0A2K0UTK3_GIBNY|nr:hypothetical protein FNYG_14184 [Fusarium nygamai]
MALLPTYWTCRDNTILDSLDKETVDSIYAEWENRESKLSTTEFDFDYELINTRTYRRALAQAQTRSKRQLPHRELDSPGREPNSGIIEPIEDLIDLSYEPSQQGASMSPHMPYMSYMDLTGLRVMPRTADEGADSSESLDSCQTAEPADTGESDLSPDSRDKELQDRAPRIRRWPQTTTKDAVTRVKQDKSQQGAALKGCTPVTTDTFRTKATKSLTALIVDYFEGRKGESLHIGGRPTVVVCSTSKREVVDIKDHPEVKEASRVDRTTNIASDELLDDSPMGSSQSPNISNLQQSLADLEAKHGHGRRRQASPRGSDDNTRPRRTIIARRPRPKVKQS